MIRGSGKSMLGGEGFCTRSPLFCAFARIVRAVLIWQI